MKRVRPMGSVPKFVPWADEQEWNTVRRMVFSDDIKVQQAARTRCVCHAVINATRETTSRVLSRAVRLLQRVLLCVR